MREKIWRLVRLKVPEGQILPWWALAVRAVLYPLDSFYWWMDQSVGYQWRRDVWLINGASFSGESLAWLANQQGGCFRVTRQGDTVVLEEIDRVSVTMENTVARLDAAIESTRH